MFSKKELEVTRATAEMKINDISNDDSDKYSDVEYIRNLQTLHKLKDAVDKEGRDEADN